MLLHNIYLKQIVLGLLTYSALAIYVFASSQNVLATTLRLAVKPIATLQATDKAPPALCVQIDLTPCTSYNPLQLKEPELFKPLSGSTIQIQGLDWVTATTSNMYLIPVNMLSASSSCASVNTLETSTVLKVSAQIEGNTKFSASLPLPTKLETDKIYNICASGIGSDQQALDNNKTVLLFQIKTFNNKAVSQAYKSSVQGDTTHLGLLSTLALLLAIAAILLYIFVSKQANIQIQSLCTTKDIAKSPAIDRKVEEPSEGHPEEN